MVQAPRDRRAAVRAANRNFGTWERWRLAPDGGDFENVAWKRRTLGCEIHEVRCCLLSSIFNAEIERRHAEQRLEEALAATDLERAEAAAAYGRLKRESTTHIQNVVAALRAAQAEHAVLKDELAFERAQVGDMRAALEGLEKALARAGNEKAQAQTQLAEFEERARLSDEAVVKLKQETAAVIAHLTENHKKTVDFLEEEHRTKMFELEAELNGREEALQSIAERVTTYLSPAAAAPPASRPDSSSLDPPSRAGSARRAAPPSAGPFRASHAAPAGGVKFDVDPNGDKENVGPTQVGKAPLLQAARPAGAEPRAPEAGDTAAAPSASRANGAATPVKAFTTADQGAPEDLRAPDSHAILIKSGEYYQEFTPTKNGKAAATVNKIDRYLARPTAAGGKRVGPQIRLPER